MFRILKRSEYTHKSNGTIRVINVRYNRVDGIFKTMTSRWRISESLRRKRSDNDASFSLPGQGDSGVLNILIYNPATCQEILGKHSHEYN